MMRSLGLGKLQVWWCQQRPCFLFLSAVTVLSSVPKQLLYLSKYLFLEVTKSFPRKFSHLGNFPFLPHLGLLLLKHMEGIYQTVQLETTRREAEKWGQVATRKATKQGLPCLSMHRTCRELNKHEVGVWMDILRYPPGSQCMKWKNRAKKGMSLD